MDKAERRQARLDITRLGNAADRLERLSEAYTLALDDLHIARQGLESIALWSGPGKIKDRAMDTLSIMYHK